MPLEFGSVFNSHQSEDKGVAHGLGRQGGGHLEGVHGYRQSSSFAGAWEHHLTVGAVRVQVLQASTEKEGTKE